MCGNHLSRMRLDQRVVGSPPRVREPPLSQPRMNPQNRITPACAGTTRIHRIGQTRTWDHPRVCGNHCSTRWALMTRVGSPPRVREPHFHKQEDFSRSRITPACAGTTRFSATSSRLWEDHPRVCGNHADMRITCVSSSGSPPRVREPPPYTDHISRYRGITPACAGTTQLFGTSDPFREDHPRVCGNHMDAEELLRLKQGSPPRVREPHLFKKDRQGNAGITPACAGTTKTMANGSERMEDHPRVCGNHTAEGGGLYSVVGSPPRVREPRESHDYGWEALRITPACAGTTITRRWVIEPLRDHPRVCGNHDRSTCRHLLD